MDRGATFQVERVVQEAPVWVAGRILDGEIRVGDTLAVEGARLRVRDIIYFRRSLTEAQAGMVVALVLDVPRAEFLTRGMLLTLVV